MDSIPHFSLGSAALIIFVLCAGFILIRGVTRMLLGALILAGSAWVGFLVWQHSPALAIDWTGQPTPWITNGLPITAFIASFVVSRLVIGFFLRPFRRSDAPRSGFSVITGLILTLISTGILWLTGATLIHHFGSIAEIGKSSGETSTSPVGNLVHDLKESVAAVIPAPWLQRLDPLADPRHLSLAKLIASESRPEPEPVIDPDTGRPYPRAIIVDDPALQSIASEGRFDILLRHPLFQKALDDPKVREALKARGL